MRLFQQFCTSRLLFLQSIASLARVSFVFSITAVLTVLILMLAMSVPQPVRAQETPLPTRLTDKALQKSSKQVSKQGFKQETLRSITLQTPDGLDFQTLPAAYPARDGHLVLTGSAEVWVPRSQFIELMPNAALPGFTAVALIVFVNGVRTQVIGVEGAQEIPVIRVDPPTGDCNRKRVQVVAFDATGNARTVMQCNVRARLFNPTATLQVHRQGETCTLLLENRDSLSEVYLYLDGRYLGHVGEGMDTINLDTHSLFSGTHRFQIMAKNVDGVLIPEMRAGFTIP